MSSEHDAWTAGRSYEHYMGRWSRLIAERFIDWLDPPRGANWLEIGCGTGALTAAILARTDPSALLSVDSSADFVAFASDALNDDRLRVAVADARDLPAEGGSIDVAVSGLVLNFVPNREEAFAEMRRVLRSEGLAAFYVWDYPGGGMGFIDAFWRAAAEADPAAAALDEGARFPFCTEAALTALCKEAGLRQVRTAALEIETKFADFDDFWLPFTLGAGPAPGYCGSLDDAGQARLKTALAGIVGTDGPISLPARAWAVRAIR